LWVCCLLCTIEWFYFHCLKIMLPLLYVF
jgi:hypothetical protein